MFPQIPRQAGNSREVGVTEDGVNLDSQEIVTVKIDPNLLLKLHVHINTSIYLPVFFIFPCI